MENASKAMIIAGAILIAILIISIGVLIWMNYAGFSMQNEQNRRAQQLKEFNTKFEKYEYNDKEKTNYITAQDARTIVNYANDYNKKYSDGEGNIEIKVTYSGTVGKYPNMFKWKEDDWIEFLNESAPDKTNKEGKKYKCIIKKPENDDIIREITIQDNK